MGFGKQGPVKKTLTKGNRNPAWGDYNETLRKINEEYESAMKPLRSVLSVDLEQTEKKFDKQLEPILIEKRTALGRLREDFTKKADEQVKKRDDAVRRAREVLNAELEAQKEQKKEEAVPA